MKRLLNKVRKFRDEEDEDMMGNNAMVLRAVANYQSQNQPHMRGSHVGRAPNMERFREERGNNLMQDYFIERSVFNDVQFRTRYRMSYDVFNRIFVDICQYDSYFVQKSDATNKVGLLPQQKLTSSLRMLAYGASADACDEYCRMGKSTSIESLQRFCRGIVTIYSKEYLRAPTTIDLRRLLAKADKRGFPGMIGSIDCMHWQWKNCPSGWAGEYSGRKHFPTIILEAVASYDTWIWHAFFGVPGACNDLNVLAQSPLFDELTGGRAPQVLYQVNNIDYNLCYYLADGIYPKWATFVKSIPRPTLEKDILFSKCQEGYRKDVERCFGILQSRFGIVRGAARGWDKEDIRYIMLTCVILHNMIIEDERPDDELESDEENEDNMMPRKASVWERPDTENFEPVGRDGHNIEGFMDRYHHIRSEYAHSSLQNDLKEHLWHMKGNMRR